MKILHIIPTYLPAYQHGGSVKGVHDLCSMLAKKGHQVSVFTTNIDREKKLNVKSNTVYRIDGVDVTYYPVKFLKKYYFSPALFLALRLNVKEFDLVHIHSVFLYPTYAASYWCKKKGIPYLINPFGALDPDMIKFKRPLLKRIYIKLIETSNINNAAAVHLASEYEKKRFLSLNFNVPAFVVPRGILIKEYDKRLAGKSLQSAYPCLRGKKIVLFFGRIHPKKGLENLGIAFKGVIKKEKNAFLVIAGCGDIKYYHKIKSFYKSIGLADKIIFTGMFLGKEKLSAFYSSDIFVLPSYGENFGITVLEVMACNLPVVVTNKVGLYPYIKDFNSGIVVNNDPQNIEYAVSKLLACRNLRSVMGQNGKKLVQEKFRLEQITDRMIGFYRSVINK